MRNARLLLLLAALLFALTRLGAQDLRFSATLTADERSVAGLGKLSSDQVAVIDALVRRDTGRLAVAAPATADAKEPVKATFTQRLTANERATAGLAVLNDAEVAQLDALVERHQAAKLARTLLAPPTFLSPRPPRGDPTERKTERELHGSFSLSYGFGSGGYSEKSGAMNITLEDPTKGYAISIGYAESHIKGGNYIYRDPRYDRPPIVLPDDPPRP